MKYRKLGSTGMVISSLGLGTMYFGDETPESDAFAILDAFVEGGGNLIDTADVYAKGMSEQVVGRWLKERPSEIVDRVVLATKGRGGTGPDVNDVGLSRRHLHRALDASRQRLGVDTIDLYQLHAWDPHTPVEETLSFLDDAVRAGKILYVGLSNFTGWQLQLMISTARAMGVSLPVSLQQQYSLLSRESEWEVIPAALHNEIGVLPWSPLAGGFLSGKYQRGGKPGSATRAGSNKPLYQWTSAEYAKSDQNWDIIDAVVQIAKDLNATPSQVALSWLANRPSVAAPIIGARTVQQLTDALGSVDLTLDADATAKLSELSVPKCGCYPYGAFGVGQRKRSLESSVHGVVSVVSGGSEHPLGRR